MCKNVQISAVIADIFLKFGANMLNWILNDPRNFYQKQTLDGEIIEFFRRGPVFFTHPVYASMQYEIDLSNMWVQVTAELYSAMHVPPLHFQVHI